MSKRWIAALILIATAPVAASAQFTTFIAPPNPVKDSIKAVVVAEQKAMTDSITRTQIANMKTWVDSAAGIAIPASDSVYAVKTITATTATTIPSNGMIAPSTASPLPFILALGLAGMLVGLGLMSRPGPVAVKANRN